MIKTDVVVVGAGPAGSVTAQRLAKKGMKVMLLDKATFPRDKTCGDAVTLEGLDAFERTGLGDWVKQFKPITCMRFSAPDGQVLDVPVRAKNGGLVGRIIPRRLMDNELVHASVKAGADLKEGTRVEHIDLSGDRLTIRADGLDVEAQLLILAEGSHATLARHLGLVKDEHSDLMAVRQYLAGDCDPSGPVEFHFQKNVLPGYTWLIPEGDGKMNIGCGTYTWRVQRKEIDLKNILENFKACHPVTPDRFANTEALGPVRGHPLHTRLDRTRTHSNRVLVVGDAAGLVSPLTGEGIASAMRSGERAAIQAVKAFEAGDFSTGMLAGYTRSIEKRYKADQSAGRFLRSVLKDQGLLNRAITRLIVNKDLAELFALIFLDEHSPRLLLRPMTLLRLLI